MTWIKKNVIDDWRNQKQMHSEETGKHKSRSETQRRMIERKNGLIKSQLQALLLIVTAFKHTLQYGVPAGSFEKFGVA
jgi:hypothetical protein